MPNSPPPEIVPADARQRRLALLATVVIAAAGAVVLWWLDHRLEDIRRLAEQNLPAATEEALRLVGAVVLCVGASFVGLGLWLFRLGVLINRAGRFPPPGTKVVRDTVVRTGVQARALANAALLASLLSVLAGTAGMWYVYRLARTLLGG